MTALELIAVAFSIACVVFAARRHIGTWPAGIVAVIAYFVVFVDTKLYADAVLQLVFLAQGIYGWLRWTRGGGASESDGPVDVLRMSERVRLAVLIPLAALLIGIVLSRYTDASRPYVDATVSVLSLAANWLLARRMLENWVLWLTADVIYIWLFLSKGLVASAALYTLFLALAIAGWRAWLHSMSAADRVRMGWVA